MTIHIAMDLIGWLGAAMVISAYCLISTNRVNGQSSSYQILNLIGGGCLITNTIFYHAYPSAFINLIWAGIAIWALSSRTTASKTTD